MIAVFKTSVTHPLEANRLKPGLDGLSPQWNFDLSDCDRILRVKIQHQSDTKRIRNVLLRAGFLCEELSD